MKIALNLIKSPAKPVRKKADQERMAELVASVKANGVISPPKVRPTGKDYEVVYGGRRIEAARRSGIKELECIVEGFADDVSLVQALVENLQREDINEFDAGDAMATLADEFGMTIAQIAEAIGKSESWVQHRTNLARDEVARSVMSRVGAHGEEPDRDLARKAVDARGAFKDNEPARREALAYITPKRERDIRDPLKAVAKIDDPQTQVAVLKKARKENLPPEQLQHVAEAIAAAPTPSVRTKLLEHTYDTFVHDPARVREQAKRTPGRDPAVQKRTARQDKDWRETPAVAEMLIRLDKIAKEWAPEFVKLVKIGKLDPKGYTFVAARVRRTIASLEKLLEALEESNG